MYTTRPQATATRSLPSIASIAAQVDAAQRDRLCRARRLQRQAQRLARSQGAAQPAPSPDPVLRFPGIREGTTLREVFDRFRALGREPHALGFRGDDAILAAMARQDAASDTSVPWAGEFEPIDRGTDYPWAGQIASQDPAAVAPHPRLGINKGRYHVEGFGSGDDSCATLTLDACRYGWFYQALCDVAAAGGSIVRQFEGGDLVWNWMFESGDRRKEIPEPVALYRLLTDDAGTTFEAFNLMMVACLLHGTRLQPTVFTLGGGSKLNDNMAETDAFPDTEHDLGVTFSQVRSVAPTAGVILPAAGGWAAYYWDEGRVGVGAEGTAATAQSKRAFERYCLHVLSHDTDVTDPYMLECARRKSLALVAFGAGLGEHLALWDRVLAGFGLCVTEVVPYVELGNEMSVFWRTGEAGGAPFDNSARELACFITSLAGPMAQACPKLRFSAPGIAAWGPSDPAVWQRRVDWFRRVFTLGLGSELDHLNLVQERRAMDEDDLGDAVDATIWDGTHPEQAAWLETCEASGLCIWPPAVDEGGLDPRHWLHHVNMHWFHSSDREGLEPIDEYATEGRMLADITYLKDRLLTCVVGNRTLTLSWALHPGGFPSAQPTRPGSPRDDDASGSTTYTHWSSVASPLFQAGMVVRILLASLSQGAEIASWHTHMAGIVRPGGTGWSIYATMGVRTDIIAGPPDSFRAAQDAFRRPAWYTFRRLSALLAGDVMVRMVHADDDGFMLVRLDSVAGFSGTAPELGAGAGLYESAWVAWLDQTSPSPSRRFTLRSATPTHSTRLSLAPSVVAPALAPGADGCGYADGGIVTWRWGEAERLPDGEGDWTDVANVDEETDARGVTRTEVTVYRASTALSPVPLCLFSNGVLLDVD